MIIRNCAYLFIKHLCIFRRMQSWQQNFWSLKMIFSDFRIFFTWSTFRRAIRLWRRKNNCAHLLVYNDSKFHYEKLTFSFSYCNNTSILHEVCIFCRRSIVVVSYQEPSKEDRNSILVREKHYWGTFAPFLFLKTRMSILPDPIAWIYFPSPILIFSTVSNFLYDENHSRRHVLNHTRIHVPCVTGCF